MAKQEQKGSSRKPITRPPAYRLICAHLPERRPSILFVLHPLLVPLAMVAARSSNERPYVSIPTNTRPLRNPVHWLPHPNGTDDDQPPEIPPKDPNYNPVFLSPVSTSTSPDTYTRPRYTSFSVYEPQSATMAFPEPQLHRLTSQRSLIGPALSIRHRASKSDVALGTISESLRGSISNRGSYAPTVFHSFRFL